MKTLKTTFVFLFVAITAMAQQEKGITGTSNWLNNWTEFKPTKVDYGEATQILAGKIATSTKLLKKNIYVLQGTVYVINNSVLTIEPGTRIIGDFESKGALVITKGSSIIADGLETDPIVFTSNNPTKKPGDWGGLVILGDSPISKFGNVAAIALDLDPVLTTFGGTNVASNSGILRYVRIEFAGKKIKGNSEGFNGLLLAGVGSKTIFDNIMVSYCGGNSVQVQGGDVTLSKIVSFRSSKDDLKFTLGTQARIDNSLIIRSSYLSSGSGVRCLEVVAYDKKDEIDFTKKQTAVAATNLTLINDSKNLIEEINSGLIKEAIFVGENASINLKRSVVSGFNPAVLLDRNIVIDDASLKKIRLEEMYFNNCKGNIFTEYASNNEDLESWYGSSSFFNVYAKSDNTETFVDILNEKKPDFRLKIAKITAQK